MSCSYYTFRSNDYYCMKKQDYVNSDTYYKYCRNYDYDDCPIYKHDSSSGGCYLTTACVEAKGLPDDCHELETLRQFRDGWLKEQPAGQADICHYYHTAPKIVAAINESTDSAVTYDKLYAELVQPCVAMIEQGDFEGAYRLYRRISLELEKRWL